jgi:RNA polymerase sigma-70 factor (ECF subfamily)
VLRKGPTHLEELTLAETLDLPTRDIAPGETGAAIEALVALLPPLQRVVLLLGDVFDFRGPEIAEMLGTSPGAVKAALHRARTNLRAHAADEQLEARTGVPPARRSEPLPVVVERYLDAFNRRDPDAIAALLDPAAVTEVVGDAEERGRDISRRYSLAEWAKEAGAQEAEYGYLYGRPVVFVYAKLSMRERALSWVIALDIAQDRILKQRLYYFCPDFLQHAAAELGVPADTHGYQYIPPA